MNPLDWPWWIMVPLLIIYICSYGYSHDKWMKECNARGGIYADGFCQVVK